MIISVIKMIEIRKILKAKISKLSHLKTWILKLLYKRVHSDWMESVCKQQISPKVLNWIRVKAVHTRNYAKLLYMIQTSLMELWLYVWNNGSARKQVSSPISTVLHFLTFYLSSDHLHNAAHVVMLLLPCFTIMIRLVFWHLAYCKVSACSSYFTLFSPCSGREDSQQWEAR